MKQHGALILLICMLFVTLCAVIPASAAEPTGNLQTQGYVLAVSNSSHSNDDGKYANGMSVFYLLSDGTFLVFDGGQGLTGSSIDAHHLYSQMSDVAKANGIEQIIVSAWVITHAHTDHYGFARVFLPTYKNDVQIREFWFNGIANNTASNEVTSLITSNYPNTPIRKLTLGEKINLADIVVEVMMTPEALLADDPDAISTDFNNSSLVLKLMIGSKTVLMTGDATIAAWDWLVAKYPKVNGVSALKSDILQVPHHGSKDAGTNAGYDLVDADTLVYPAGAPLFEKCVDSSSSNYQESTVYAIKKTARKNGDFFLLTPKLTTLLEKDYFFLAGEYLGTETDLSSTRQCFITSDVDYSATTEMLAGASVRISARDVDSNSLADSGIRFMSTVPKATLDAADALVANAELNVASYSFGTLIFKACLLDGITGPISAAAFDAADMIYADIPAKNGIKKDNADGSWTLFAALVNLNESNYNVDFAAISYIEYHFDNGSTIRTYSEFNRVDNVRNMEKIARSALADTSPVMISDRLVDGFYYNMEIAVGENYYIKESDGSFTKAVRGESDPALYSPYSAEQRDVLRLYLSSNYGTLSGFKKDDTAIDPW